MKYHYAMKMPLEKARLCLECDTIHDLVSCPQCGSAAFFYLATWVKPARPPRPVPEERPAAPAAPPKKRHWVRNTLLAGASVIAAYQLLFKPSRKKPPEEIE